MSIHVVKADFSDRISFSSGVTLFSPLNRTYDSRFLTLDFGFALGWGIQYSLNYVIDGKYGGPMPYVIKNPEELHVIYYATGSVKLPELTEVSHSLTVSLEAPGITAHRSSYADTIYFAIDLAPPNMSIISPANKNYMVANITALNIPLDFTVSENVSRVVYNLDGLDNVTIAGNTTLTGLSVGEHNLTIYAWDAVDHVAVSETTYFAILEKLKAEEPEAQPFPVLQVETASAISAAIGVVSLFVYLHSKQRKENGKQMQ